MSCATAPTRTIDVNGTPFVYREIGDKADVPVVFLHHLTAVIDDWDPRVIDGIAAEHQVIVFDNRGVGGTSGDAPATVEEMARDTVAFIRALGLAKVNLLGFSLGGFLAQVIAREEPALVRKVIIAGSSAEGGEGIAGMGGVLMDAVAKAQAAGKHPKHFLFFSQTANSQAAANAFLARLNERKEDRVPDIANATIGAQVTAIHT